MYTSSRRRFPLSWCVSVIAASLTFATALAGELNLADPANSPRLLVRFKHGTPPAGKQAAHAAAQSLRTLKEYSIVPDLQLIQVPAGGVSAARTAYENDPNVLYVLLDEPFIRLHAIPDDPYLCALWGLHNTSLNLDGCEVCDVECPDCPAECPYDLGKPDADIDAVQAWDVWTGDPNFRIAIIDTGVDYNHPDLTANMWVNDAELNGQTGVDDDGNTYIDDIYGYNFYDGEANPDPMDDHGHGTHIAGTIAAVGDNGIGVTGINWRAKIVALKVFNFEGGGDEETWAAAILGALEYCKVNNIRVSNNSYGWDVRCTPEGTFRWDLYNAIQGLNDFVPGGHIFVASAGNWYPESTGCDNRRNNDNPATQNHPSSFDLDNIIAVAATDNDDDCWWKSMYGLTTVDLGAPGVNVYSTWFDDTYAFLNGTSMAAPHVTGVAALVWGRYPDWTGQQVRDRIFSTVRKVDSLHPEGATPTVYGGVVNAMRAVWYDCNANTVSDELDIICGTSLDCRGLESDCCVPQEDAGCGDQFIEDCVCSIDDSRFDWCCEELQPWAQDCARAAASFCGGGCNEGSDGIPDECQPSRDCDGNEIPDACDLNCEAEACSGFDCQPGASDCNCNGDPDLACDLEHGVSEDCNANNIPDECDILDRRSCDIDENGIPDECGACCTGTTCANTLEAGCVVGNFYADYACPRPGFTPGPGECTCYNVVCCKGPYDCVDWESGCSCKDNEGFVVAMSPAQCGQETCITGACCTDPGPEFCIDEMAGGEPMTEAGCEYREGTYVGGADCDDNNPCTEPLPDCDGSGVPDECDIHMGTSSDCNTNGVPDECDVASGGGSADENSNGVPDECEPDILFVDAHATGTRHTGTTWCQAFTDLQEAIAVAEESLGTVREIRVANGTYTPAAPCGSREATFFLVEGLAIRGGYAGCDDPYQQRDIAAFETILSGDLNSDDVANLGEGLACFSGPGEPYEDGCELFDVDDDGDVDSEDLGNDENSYHVVHAIDVDASAILDGFTISGGNADSSFSFPHNVGGGLLNGSGDPTVTSCTFLENTAEFRGGALYNCTGSPKLTNCTFGGNSSAFGGAVYNYDGGAPAFVNCFFHGNSAFRGAGVFNNGNTSLVNCIFTGNMADGHGGGMNSFSGDPTLVNCTFSQNSGDYGGGFAFLSGFPELTNCILWGNTDNSGSVAAGQVYYEDEQLNYSNFIIVTFSCIQDDAEDGVALPGTENIDSNPKFADPNGEDDVAGTNDDNLRLTWDPEERNWCIDRGNNAVVTECALDADGNQRRWDDPGTPNDCPVEVCGDEDEIVDKGAFEFASEAGTDCNSNGLDDACEINAGLTEDCQPNGVPDVCDIANCSPGVAWCSDCNDNGVPDGCDEDGNGNGIPDECEPTVTGLEVFYPGRFLDEPDTSKSFLAAWATATTENVTNYLGGITGIRVFFDSVVDFATTAEAAFTFEWTTSEGTTFSPVTDPQSSITVTAADEGGVTVVTIVLAEDYVRRRWLKVTIDAAQVTANGVELDGELAGNPAGLPSGNGTPGGDAVFYLGNFAGDVDGNRETMLTDIAVIRDEVDLFHTVPITNVYDVDKSGKVLLADVAGARLDVSPVFVGALIAP